MKICAKMFNELNFEPVSISPCCNTRALKIPAFPYSGGEIDLEKYGKHIENVLLDIQSGSNTCKNCPELVEIDGSPHITNGKFHAISINMHRHFCNCKCCYCNLWQSADKGMGYNVLPALKSLKEKGALADNCWISWGGGEPSILPIFEEAAEWALANGIFQIVHTNAIKYSNAIARLLRRGRGLVNISLDSATPKTYRSVKGVDCFEKVLENLKAYASAAPEAIQLKYIVFERNNNLQEIERFLGLAKILKVGLVEYSFNFEELNQGTISENTLCAAAYLEKTAKTIGLPNVQRFFIDAKWQKMIDERMAKV